MIALSLPHDPGTGETSADAYHRIEVINVQFYPLHSTVTVVSYANPAAAQVDAQGVPAKRPIDARTYSPPAATVAAVAGFGDSLGGTGRKGLYDWLHTLADFTEAIDVP